MTNNEAEYEALLYGLELALKLGIHNLKVYEDLEFVMGHVNGIFEVNVKIMKVYCGKATELTKRFRRIDIQAIKRKLNVRANGLARSSI